MTDNIVRDSAQKGLSYIIYPKTNIFWLFVNYFTIILIMKAVLTYGASYLPADLPMAEPSSQTPEVSFGMYAKVIIKHFLSLLFGLPILVAVAKSILSYEDSTGYFHYFNMYETWRLFIAHIVLFVLVGIPSFILLESLMMTFFYKTPESLDLAGPALALMSLTYMLILSLLFGVVLYFVARFTPLYVPVAIGNPIDLGRVFDLTRGEAWKVFVAVLISGLPVMIFSFFTTGNLSFPTSANITKQIQPAMFGTGFDFMDIILNTTITTVIAFLSVAPFAALCNMYAYLVQNLEKRNKAKPIL